MISPEEAFNNMNQTLGQVKGQISQQQANYSNGYLTLAAKVAGDLVLTLGNVEEAVKLGFQLSETFRLQALAEDLRLRALAPVDPMLLQQEEAMLLNIKGLEDHLTQLKAEKDAKQTSKSNSNLVELLQNTKVEATITEEV